MLHAPLPRLLTSNICKAHSSLRLVIDIRKRDLRNEILGLPRLANHTIELVNLFESKTLRLVDHEEDESNADEAESAPNEEDFALEVGAFLIDHVGGGIGNGPVQKPVAGSLEVVSLILRLG